MPIVCGTVQRCPLIISDSEDAGTLFDEQPDHRLMSLFRGPMQWCRLIYVGSGDVGALLDE
jgi:hypothetical protein